MPPLIFFHLTKGRIRYTIAKLLYFEMGQEYLRTRYILYVSGEYMMADRQTDIFYTDDYLNSIIWSRLPPSVNVRS